MSWEDQRCPDCGGYPEHRAGCPALSVEQAISGDDDAVVDEAVPVAPVEAVQDVTSESPFGGLPPGLEG